MNDAAKFLLGLTGCARPNVHARYKKGKGGKVLYVPEHRPIALAEIQAHLRSETPIGVYFLKEKQTRLAAFDLDDHEGEANFEDVREPAFRLAVELRKWGLNPLCVLSGGGRGIHILVVWQEDQSARSVRQLMQRVVRTCELRVGTGGVKKKEVEIFPKQDEVTNDGLGNLIALPFARNSVPLDADLRPIPIGEFLFPPLTSLFSQPIVADAGMDLPEEQEEHQETRLPGDETEAEAALRHISARDRDHWIKCGHILKHEFAESGYKIWLTWSATGRDKYIGEHDCKKVWDSINPNGKIGIGSLFHLARDNGWNGPGNQVIREMNGRYAVLPKANKTIIIIKKPDPRDDHPLQWMAKDVFFDKLRPETVPDGDDGRAEKSKIWWKHPLRETLDRLEFDPRNPPGKNGSTWNMWRGFGVKAEEGDWSLLKDHIRENICREDQVSFEWLLNWMALGVQNPAEVIGTVPSLLGPPGTGKSVLAHGYGRLWGPHFVPVTQAEHVMGRFGGHLIAKRFCFIDEGIFGGDRRMAGVIKTRITEPKIILEQKGIDPIQMDNRMIFMVASNEDNPAPADSRDRRWMFFEVGENRREDRKFFGALIEQLESGGYEAMLWELMHRDLQTGPDPHQTIKNIALGDKIMRAQTPEYRFIFGLLDEARLPQNSIAGASTTTIKAMWEEMRKNYPNSSRVTTASLGKFINKVFVNVTTKLNGQYREGDEIERSTQYNFPPLQECRAQFSKFIGAPLEWLNDAKQWLSDNDGQM